MAVGHSYFAMFGKDFWKKMVILKDSKPQGLKLKLAAHWAVRISVTRAARVEWGEVSGIWKGAGKSAIMQLTLGLSRCSRHLRAKREEAPEPEMGGCTGALLLQRYNNGPQSPFRQFE